MILMLVMRPGAGPVAHWAERLRRAGAALAACGMFFADSSACLAACLIRVQEGSRHLPIHTRKTLHVLYLQECMAVEQELAAWRQAGGFSDRDNALRWAILFAQPKLGGVGRVLCRQFAAVGVVSIKLASDRVSSLSCRAEGHAAAAAPPDQCLQQQADAALTSDQASFP